MTAQTNTTAPVVTHHPVVVAQIEHRAANVQLRVADAITKFAGSMLFVYIHVLLFGVWMLVFEKSPWPTLTLIVSLEAIFLSTFVMIGQNRQSAFAQHKADHDFQEQELELKTNTELTRQIHQLTEEVHRRIADATVAAAVLDALRRQTGQVDDSQAPGTVTGQSSARS